MARRIRTHDWQSTSLGPIESWPPTLKTVVDLMLASGHAMQLAWGAERVVLYNDTYAPMLGTRHPGALGIPFKDAWPDVWDQIEPLVEQVFAGETVRFEEMPLIMTRKGYDEETWWNFSYSPVRDETGAVVALLNVTVEATAKHRADQAERERDEAIARLARNETRFRALATAGGNSIYQMSADWRRLYQLDSETLSTATAPVDDWLQTYIPDTDLPEVRRAIDAAISSKSLLDLEHRIYLANGDIGWVHSRAVPMLGPDGVIEEWFGAISDVTAHKLAEERSNLERSRAETALLDANRHKDQFLAVLAHELRNGLAPLVYNVQIANMAAHAPARATELFARSGRQLQHLVHLVDDLLDVARISTGKIELNVELVRLRDVVNLALDACRPDAERKHHRLTVVDEAGPALAVKGDSVRLTQVVSNLLSNSTKYMDEGGSITVRIGREGELAVVEVSDTGIGIPENALPHVFELFTQVRNQQAYSAGGLGIGLSLVKQLVEMQGGSVTAASEGSGSGSTFTVRLPVAAAETAGASHPPATLGASSSGHQLRLLVVDDKPDPADTLVELLQLMGYQAEAAYGGQHALECVQRCRPDVVFLDLSMPGMDGFEVARHLRADFPAEPPMRIVALTGRGREADRLQTRAASFDGHLDKPVSSAALQSVLSEALAIAR
jgi:signal transduction histidine kinase